MSFVITNGKKFYYPEDETNKIRLTEFEDEAFIFLEKAPAMELIKKATSKLKGYRVEPYDNESNCSEDVVKVKRIAFSPTQREAVYNKCEGRCGICGKFVPHSAFTVDHIIPLSRGGANTIDNLQCACRSCNTIKQDILPEHLNDKLIEILVYYMKQHPEKNTICKQIKKARKKIKKKKK